jgi:hypothetical protein
MNLQSEINWVVKELQSIEDPTFIELIKNMLKRRNDTNNSEPVTIEEYNREIDEAEKDIESGNVYSVQEVRKISEKWGRK